MQFPVISLGTLYILTTLVTRCAFANPIKESRQLVLPENFCRPNFEGAGVTIGNSAEEWGTYPASVAGAHVNNRSHRPSIFGYADFRLEQDGQYPSRYIIK
ncbi:hypothetical protein AX16_007316 [Volvariella volvacea WC 439]|nr:hypothetical protein AX16_007316 [Volvariella volvacea WC 439]